ncbi:MAG: hypothetical protein GF364_07330 [Candidatus Lokiarchaeota archaeon]|nr:hypothetical protein [Candidatus Lokiarchaeota archaeon]
MTKIHPPIESLKFTIKVNNDDKNQLLFVLKKDNIELEQISSVLADQYSQIMIRRNELIALIFGYISIEDTEIDVLNELNNYNNIRRVLNILLPTLEPIWDYFHRY